MSKAKTRSIRAVTLSMTLLLSLGLAGCDAGKGLPVEGRLVGESPVEVSVAPATPSEEGKPTLVEPTEKTQVAADKFAVVIPLASGAEMTFPLNNVGQTVFVVRKSVNSQDYLRDIVKGIAKQGAAVNYTQVSSSWLRGELAAAGVLDEEDGLLIDEVKNVTSGSGKTFYLMGDGSSEPDLSGLLISYGGVDDPENSVTDLTFVTWEKGSFKAAPNQMFEAKD